MFVWLKEKVETTIGAYLASGVVGCLIGFVMGLTAQGISEEELRRKILKDVAQQASKTFEQRANAAAIAWIEKFFVYPIKDAPYVVEFNCVAHSDPVSKDNAICNVRLNNEFLELSCAIGDLPITNKSVSQIPCRLTQHMRHLFDIPTRVNY